MASGGKKKTTMAKLAREARLRERRLQKQTRKDARKRTPAHVLDWTDDALNASGEPAQPVRQDEGQAPVGPVAPPLAVQVPAPGTREHSE
ncbi:MAG TPA: hypothetical protein VMD79_06330 [Solirubrobacteraceae bacterium]|nr:hypothetical protein [Solirubrobacteraceae bacterium]